MTAIAAIAEKGKVWMGGDSAGVAGLSLTIRKDEKVFKKGPFLIGFTSSFRMGQLLRWKFKPPVHAKGLETINYMHMSFIDKVRECFKEGGYAKIENNTEHAGAFIVGYKGELFTIESDFQIGQPLDGFACCGCGDDLACGSLTTTAQYEIRPQDRIALALHAAERYSAGVRRPFLILDSEGHKWTIE